MRFVSVSELKNGTSEILRDAHRAGSVVVMRHGKPYAAVIRLSEQEIDQLLFEDSPRVKRAVAEALEDVKRKRYVTLKDYRRGKRSP
jgi:prevent-host-death family protein